MLNEITIVGRLGRDPELKITQSGIDVCSFSVVTTEKWKDQKGEKKEESQWHNIVCWGGNAKIASSYMKKGDMHLFKGTLKYEKYTKDNVERTIAKIHVKQLVLLPQKDGSAGGNKTQNDESLPPGYVNNNQRSSRPGDDDHFEDDSKQFQGNDFDDEIPF